MTDANEAAKEEAIKIPDVLPVLPLKDLVIFPFIIVARNNTKAAIFGTLASRLHNTREMELRNALAQVGEIARLRLADLIAD